MGTAQYHPFVQLKFSHSATFQLNLDVVGSFVQTQSQLIHIHDPGDPAASIATQDAYVCPNSQKTIRSSMSHASYQQLILRANKGEGGARVVPLPTLATFR